MVRNPAPVVRLADLRFNDFSALESASELEPASRLKLSRLSSVNAFPHVERLFDEANSKLKCGEEEQSFLLFYRMGAVSRLVLQKGDFPKFKGTPDGRRFHDLFKTCVSRLEELETSLTKRYQLKGYVKKEESISDVPIENDVNDDEKKENKENEFGLMISPRELVRFVENKRQALIIDYRSDRSTQMKYDKEERILVAHVPPEAITLGCIGGSLIRLAEVGERALLQRMRDVDLVVLVGSELIPLKEGGTFRHDSTEQILFKALTEYNQNFRLRRPPVFLDGGFENWRLHYPMHTTSVGGLKMSHINIDDQTEVAKAVAKYKQDTSVSDLEYPDLLAQPPRVSRVAAPIAPERGITPKWTSSEGHLPGVHESASVVSVPSADSLLSSHSASAASSTAATPPVGSAITKDVRLADSREQVDRDVRFGVAEGPSLPESVAKTPTNGDVEVTVSSGEPRSPDETSVSSATAPSVAPQRPSVPHPSPTPLIDRSTKPSTQSLPDTKSTITPDGDREASEPVIHSVSRGVDNARPPAPKLVGGTSGSLAFLPSAVTAQRPVVPDRSVKPQLISREDVNSMMTIYDAMVKTINETSVPRRVKPGYTGLYNLGNTCFMNATLQALFNTQCLREIFHRDSFPKLVNRKNSMGTRGVISASFSALMDAVWSGCFAAIRPQQFLETFAGEVNASLADRRQHDAQEFQIFLLDALHEDTNRVNRGISFEQNYTGDDLFAEANDYEEKSRKFANSPVNDIFSCQTVSHVQCNTCHNRSVTFEEMTQLSLELPGRSPVSLEDCINAHFRPVLLDGSSKWNCPRCKALRTATRTTRIWKLPSVFVIHLKRFSYAGDGWEKNDVLVRFDLLPLDLTPYMHPVVSERARKRNEYFNLYAVTNHSGTLNSGHYTACVRNEETKEWLLYDDECISPIGVDSVCTKKAFILYYKKKAS